MRLVRRRNGESASPLPLRRPSSTSGIDGLLAAAHDEVMLHSGQLLESGGGEGDTLLAVAPPLGGINSSNSSCSSSRPPTRRSQSSSSPSSLWPYSMSRHSRRGAQLLIPWRKVLRNKIVRLVAVLLSLGMAVIFIAWKSLMRRKKKKHRRPPPPRRYALCFYGLTRSLNWTLPTISHHIMAPILKHGHSYDIFIHTYHLRDVVNERANEQGTYTHGDDYKMLEATRALVTSQPAYDELLVLSGEVERIRDRYNYDESGTVVNILRARHSLSLSWDLMAQHALETGAVYDAVIALRADVAYLADIDIERRAKMEGLLPQNIFVPPWGSYGGVNDRFAFGHPDAMRTYMNRQEPCDDAALGLNGTYNSEQYLKAYLQVGGPTPLEVFHTNMLLVRLRISGDIAANDTPQMNRSCREQKSPWACDLPQSLTHLNRTAHLAI
jgi:hypothetical protein